jgi:hypothetical protein
LRIPFNSANFSGAFPPSLPLIAAGGHRREATLEHFSWLKLWARGKVIRQSFFSAVLRANSLMLGQQRSKLFQNLICRFPRQFADELSFSHAPIEILHLIGKNDSSELRSRKNRHLEWITLYLACDRTPDR